MSWIVRFCSCSKWKASAPRPCVRPPARHPGGGLPFAVLRATPPCTVAATASLRSGLQHALTIACALSLAGPRAAFVIATDAHYLPHHFAPAAEAAPSPNLRYPSHPQETTFRTFFVLRQKGAVFSACCAVSRALHLSKVLLSQLGFHRVHIPSYALPPPQRRCALLTVAALHKQSLRGRRRFGLPASLPVQALFLFPRSPATFPASPPSTVTHARASQRSCPILSASTAPARSAPVRITPLFNQLIVTALEGVGLACLRFTVQVRLGSVLFAATFPDSPSPACAHAPVNGRQVTANTGSRPAPARLDTWTRAARLSTLRPLPPTPPFLRALSRSDQWPQYVGGRGLRSPLKRATVSPNPFTEERRF